jgi:small-conductance mechanosensitive channel
MNAVSFDDFQHWLSALAQPTTLVELAVLAACVALAWCSVWMVRRSVGADVQWPIWLGRVGVDGVMFPLALLLLAYICKMLLANRLPNVVLRIAVPVLLALVVIRVGVKVLQAAFREAPLVRTLERSISWMAWGAMVLWVSGLLPLVLDALDQIHWKMGNSTMSVRTLIEAALTAGAVLIVSLWVSSMIEDRLLRSATGGELSVRKAISNATRALLMFVGLMLALSSVGVDLTALSVLGGALGVGIGFGLQKLAANYVSGFVILAERSMRIGDNVRVDGFEGAITDIRARYTVIRSPQGRESIVPNEMLMTGRVENLSLADRRLWQSTSVSVGYDADVDQVLLLLHKAAIDQERVLKDPPPAVFLSNFAADGLEFTVGYWVADPENGQLNLRSQINLAILQALRAHQIEIPYPQRVVHQRNG